MIIGVLITGQHVGLSGGQTVDFNDGVVFDVEVAEHVVLAHAAELVGLAELHLQERALLARRELLLSFGHEVQEVERRASDEVVGIHADDYLDERVLIVDLFQSVEHILGLLYVDVHIGLQVDRQQQVAAVSEVERGVVVEVELVSVLLVVVDLRASKLVLAEDDHRVTALNQPVLVHKLVLPLDGACLL